MAYLTLCSGALDDIYFQSIGTFEKKNQTKDVFVLICVCIICKLYVAKSSVMVARSFELYSYL